MGLTLGEAGEPSRAPRSQAQGPGAWPLQVTFPGKEEGGLGLNSDVSADLTEWMRLRISHPPVFSRSPWPGQRVFLYSRSVTLPLPLQGPKMLWPSLLRSSPPHTLVRFLCNSAQTWRDHLAHLFAVVSCRRLPSSGSAWGPPVQNRPGSAKRGKGRGESQRLWPPGAGVPLILVILS